MSKRRRTAQSMDTSTSLLPSTSTSLLDLNDDCLRHLCSFLISFDIMKLVLISDRFVDTISSIDFTDTEHEITLKELEQSLSRIGPKIKRINFTFFGFSVEQMSLLRKYCQYVEHIDCSEIKEYAASCRTVIDSSLRLKFLNLDGCGFRDCHCRPLSNLPELQYLNLANNTDITGKYLNNLINLKKLNLNSCESIKLKHLIAIFKATKLNTLDIGGVEDDSSDYPIIKTLVETQTELEKLTISTDCEYNIANLSQLKNLKHLYLDGEPPVDLLAKLAQNRRENLESLRIHFSKGNPKIQIEIEKHILKFRNLKRLDVLSSGYTDEFLIKMSKSLTKLEELTLSKNQEVDLEILRNLKCLKVLNMTTFIKFNEEKYQQVIEIKKKEKKLVPLKINSNNFGVSESFLQSGTYNRNKNILLLHIYEYHENNDEWNKTCCV